MSFGYLQPSHLCPSPLIASRLPKNAVTKSTQNPGVPVLRGRDSELTARVLGAFRIYQGRRAEGHLVSWIGRGGSDACD